MKTTTTTRSERMDRGDYTVVCFRQTLLATGDRRPLPKNWLDLVQRFDRAEFNPSWDLADELFGFRRCSDTGEELFGVERLTKKESAIAARMDLTHSEKIDLIKPLRTAREARSDRNWDGRYAAEKMREYLVSQVMQEVMCDTEEPEAESAPTLPSTCQQPTKVIVGLSFEERVSEADTIRARGMGISLTD